MREKRRKIAFIGSRGIPALHGGFETFAEELTKEIKKNTDFDILVVGDQIQKQQTNNLLSFNEIEIKYSKFSKQKQPFLFYLDSLFLSWKADVIYSCGCGNAFFLFVPILFQKAYITNPDGVGWERLKWSNFGKKVLKLMFYLSAKLSPYILADSKGIEKVFREKFKRKKRIETIEYGANLNEAVGQESDKINAILDKYNLKKREYHLVVSRLEPENNVDIIIGGYKKSDAKYPLVIVGNLQETNYINLLRASQSEEVIFLNGIYDKYELSVVRANAFSYFHGHAVGGTNPSLLEAMASKNLCICHKNEFNKAVVGANGLYFKSEEEIAKIITKIEAADFSNMKEGVYELIKRHYNWEIIGERYIAYFNKIIK